MARIKGDSGKYKIPELIKVPEETSKFLSYFKGNHIFVSIDKEGKVIHRFGDISEHIDELNYRNKKDSSIYFTVNESVNGRRRIIDMVKARAVFLDDDKQKDSYREDFLLDPSIIVETSPGKYHYYWLTETEDIKTWEKVLETMIQVYETDPSIKDISRVLRLPGFIHPKANFKSRIVFPANGADPEYYNWNQILEAFPPKKTPQQAADDTEYNNSDKFSVMEKITAFMNADSIAPSMNSLIMHWAFRYDDDFIRVEIEKLFEQIPQNKYSENSLRYENARAQIEKFIKSARNKVNSILLDRESRGNREEALIIPKPLEQNVAKLMSNPIPRECLPESLVQAAEHVGENTGVGPEPAIVSAISITCAMLGKNVIIHEIDDSLTTHCQSGVVIAMGTGTRKTQLYKKMNKPFFDYEEELIEAWKKEKNYKQELINTLIMSKNRMIKDFARNKNPTEHEIMDHVKAKASLQDSIDKVQQVPPSLYTADVTEERLIAKLRDNNGSLAVISDDARNTIKNIMGRYSNDQGTAEGVYINGLTGSTIKYHRFRDNVEIDIRRPCMNVLLFIQPDIAIKLMNSEMFIPSGLAARLPIYYYPISGKEIWKNTSREKIDYRFVQPYYDALSRLKIQRDKPMQVRMSSAGVQACRSFDRKLVRLLETKWKNAYDKINKIVTQSVIYATCMAALDDPLFAKMLHESDGSRSEAYELPVKYINMGQMYAESVFEQTILSHESMDKKPLFDMAETVLGWVQKRYEEGKIFEGFTNNSAFRNRHSVPIRPHMDEVLNILVEYGWLKTILWPRSNGTRELNNGFIAGKVKPGTIVYQYNKPGADIFSEQEAVAGIKSRTQIA